MEKRKKRYKSPISQKTGDITDSTVLIAGGDIHVTIPEKVAIPDAPIIDTEEIKKEVLDYLNKLITNLSQLPKYYPVGFSFDKVRIYVQVSQELLKQRRQDAEERERIKRSGGTVSEENEAKKAYSPERHKEVEASKILRWDEEVRHRICRGVILGDPGFGKTWLLRYEGIQRANEGIEELTNGQDIKEITLPVYIRLADLARQDTKIDDAIISLLKDDYYVSDGFAGLLRGKIKNNTCFFLFDALDEVTDKPFKDDPISSQRTMLCRRLSAFAQNTSCRILLTSRIAGYTGSPFALAGNEREREMELLAFNKAQIEGFVSAWFHNDVDKKQGLMARISSTPQLSGLSQIPLLLSFICLLYAKSEGGVLPVSRIGFYSECIDDFLKTEWRSHRPQRSEAYINAKKELLRHIAFSLFKERKEQFTTEDLQRIIEPFLNALQPASPLHGLRSDALIQELTENDGLLVKVATGRENTPYIFLHLTFQEYLTASYIVKENQHRHFLTPHFFNPWYREVVRLTAGLLDNTEDISRFIKSILEQKPLCHEVLHQPLLLAGLCIADVPADKAGNSLGDLETRIVNDLWNLWVRIEYNTLHQSIEEAFVALVSGNKSETIIKRLLGELTDKVYRCESAVRVLGILGRADDRVIDALLGALRDKDGDVRWYVVKALGRLGRADDQIIDALLGAFRDIDGDLRWNVVEALGQLGRADDRVIEVLLQALTDGDDDERLSAAEALGRLGRTDDRVIDALLRALTDRYEDVRLSAAEVLGTLGWEDDGYIDALIRALKNESPDVRWFATVALGKLGQADDDRVIDTLLGALKDEVNFVCWNSAEALGNLGRADDRVIDALLGVLKDKVNAASNTSAVALGKLGRADDRVIDALLEALELSDKDEYMRESAAEAMGNLGRADDRVIDALLRALKDDNMFVRWSSAEALGKLGRADDQVIDGLLEALELKDINTKGEFEDMHNSAAEALGKLGRADDRVIDALLRMLKDKFGDMRSSAAEALGKLGRADDRVIDALLGALKDKDNFGFSAAAAAWVLGKLGRADDRVIEALLGAFDNERMTWSAYSSLEQLVTKRIIEGTSKLPSGGGKPYGGFEHGKADNLADNSRGRLKTCNS